MRCIEVRRLAGWRYEYFFRLGTRIFVLKSDSPVLHEFLYSEGKLVQCSEKYKLDHVLISYNEENIKLVRL